MKSSASPQSCRYPHPRRTPLHLDFCGQTTFSALSPDCQTSPRPRRRSYRCSSRHHREFFLELQRQMSGRLQLRNVSEQLKRLRRCDVVTAAHRQRDLLRWLGPVLPEELPIKHMKPSLWSRFTTALSVTTSPGSDWRGLARTLRIPQSYVELWQQRSSNPAEMVLRAWEGKATEATAGRLFDILMEMGREDLTGML
ncbi:uncharacterized protein LOC128503599 isoform X2 [Spea bombifrons]|uniref:uncharacterized protein LOC128503599 isoform X2 n=1 Tax=Spea bombifrons TaxID=233779 RepID=UPI00234B159D|nr:uncharacterized protein LOC128503599 isoform X2 [Spea bombifrons]